MDEACDNSASIWWRDIKLALHHPTHQSVFQEGIVWKVGSGDKIKFWEDRWLDGDTTLLAKYPRLYVNSYQQNHRIEEMEAWKNMGWEWFIYRDSIGNSNRPPNAIPRLGTQAFSFNARKHTYG